MARLLGHWGVTFLAVVVTAWLLPALVRFGDWVQVAIFALILALLNALARPALVLLTLPLTCLTFGLFILVINAVIFWLAALLVPGAYVAGFLGAFVAALVVSLVSTIIGWALR